MNKYKWLCEECGTKHKTKKALVECLKEHLDEAMTVIDFCCDYLEELGVKNPYK